MASINPKRSHKTRIGVIETDEKSAGRLADLFAEGLAAEQVAVSTLDKGQGKWSVTVHFSSAADERAIRDLAAAAGGRASQKLRFTQIAAKNWVGESLVGLAPVAAGRFIVHGAHDRAGVPLNRIGIEIEAALAFGTGHHGTTRGCLLALDRLAKPLRGGAGRILDLGTGSGVLAIAAARAWRRRVVATDIDAAAVRVARDNARRNRAGNLVEVVRANGVTAPRIRSAAPFDLVFANILLGPLQRLASPLANIVAPGGHVVLSGLLTAQANAAISAYRAFTLERQIALDGWTTLILRRGKRPGHAVAGRRGGS